MTPVATFACLPNNLRVPGGAVQALELFDFLLWKIHSIPVDVFVARLPADGGFLAKYAVHAVSELTSMIRRRWHVRIRIFIQEWLVLCTAASALQDPLGARVFSPKPLIIRLGIGGQDQIECRM
jgi:hypothetical protein